MDQFSKVTFFLSPVLPLHPLLGRHAGLRHGLHHGVRGHVGDLLTHLAIGLTEDKHRGDHHGTM